MTVSEKSVLESKARRAGISVGEFVRRSVDFYDPEEIAALAQLAEFAEALQRSNQQASEALDRALASIETTRKQLDGDRAA